MEHLTPLSLRHCLATVAYRGGKVLRDVPREFSHFALDPHDESFRTPGQLLSHICDLYDWALCLAKGEYVWKDTPQGDWPDDVARLFAALERLDAVLASEDGFKGSPERIFQGPIADSLTHIGQLALLRRAAGAPIKGENYYRAEIEAGRVGAEQATPIREF
jgi:hypothetical protein